MEYEQSSAWGSSDGRQREYEFNSEWQRRSCFRRLNPSDRWPTLADDVRLWRLQTQRPRDRRSTTSARWSWELWLAKRGCKWFQLIGSAGKSRCWWTERSQNQLENLCSIYRRRRPSAQAIGPNQFWWV